MSLQVWLGQVESDDEEEVKVNSSLGVCWHEAAAEKEIEAVGYVSEIACQADYDPQMVTEKMREEKGRDGWRERGIR